MRCPKDPRIRPSGSVRAGAVCYRRLGDRVQFLLVRTKGLRTWTFPKGHVERKETPRAAALREAREEAGATGDIDDGPFTRYRYPSFTAGGLPSEVCVEAYLLRVNQQAAPARGEWRRAPSWFDPEEAVARLSEHRERRWTRENQRLIQAALDRIG